MKDPLNELADRILNVSVDRKLEMACLAARAGHFDIAEAIGEAAMNELALIRLRAQPSARRLQ